MRLTIVHQHHAGAAPSCSGLLCPTPPLYTGTHWRSAAQQVSQRNVSRLTMRTFLRKPQTTQQTMSRTFSTLSRTHVRQGLDPNSILNLQRAIGNQALLRFLQSNVE